MSSPAKESVLLPVYSKLAQITIGLAVFSYILYIGRDIIIPLVFSTLIAILLNPIVNFLYKKRLNRLVAISIALLGAMIFIGSVVFFIGSQMSMFTESFPQFQHKFIDLSDDAINFASETLNISKDKIQTMIEKHKEEGMDIAKSLVGETVGTISSVFAFIFLLPVYIFMILFYKPLLMNFLGMLFESRHQGVVTEVLTETKSLIQNYLIGLLIEALILAVLNSVGLMIIGVEYAILLGVIGAILNVIPYLGGIIAIALPMLIAFATKTPMDVVWVVVVYLVIQFIDNQFLVPKIVASKVKVNALISVIVIFIGGAIWGLMGMFLSIPLTAILKVIFDRIDELKPFGYLLGDDLPADGELPPPSKRKKVN